MDARASLEKPGYRRSRLEPREVHAEADVRPLREPQVTPRIRSADVESVGVGEHVWVAVRVSKRDDHHVAGGDLGAR